MFLFAGQLAGRAEEVDIVNAETVVDVGAGAVDVSLISDFGVQAPAQVLNRPGIIIAHGVPEHGNTYWVPLNFHYVSLDCYVRPTGHLS